MSISATNAALTPTTIAPLSGQQTAPSAADTDAPATTSTPSSAPSGGPADAVSVAGGTPILSFAALAGTNGGLHPSVVLQDAQDAATKAALSVADVKNPASGAVPAQTSNLPSDLLSLLTQ